VLLGKRAGWAGWAQCFMRYVQCTAQLHVQIPTAVLAFFACCRAACGGGTPTCCLSTPTRFRQQWWRGAPALQRCWHWRRSTLSSTHCGSAVLCKSGGE
jgi:hypothetical protein